MGEIADMMLDGTLCEGCGVWLEGSARGYPGYCSPQCASDRGADYDDDDHDDDAPASRAKSRASILQSERDRAAHAGMEMLRLLKNMPQNETEIRQWVDNASATIAKAEKTFAKIKGPHNVRAS